MPDDSDSYDDRYDYYAALVAEFGARRVIDLACGTGEFAMLLAVRGVKVVGIDADEDAVDAARHADGGDAVRWFVADATTLPPLTADMVTITSELELDEAALTGIREVMLPEGVLAIRVADPQNPRFAEAVAAAGFEPFEARELPGPEFVLLARRLEKIEEAA